MKLVASILQPFKQRAMRASFVPARDGASDPQASEEGAAASTDADEVNRADCGAPPGTSRWLFPQVVLLDCDARDKTEVLDVAAATLERFHGVDAAIVARALWRREAAVTTALGHGVAVPHARIDGIAEPVTLLIRTRHPIAYEAPDRKPVTQLFVIVVPADGDANEHLRLLANVARIFSQPEFRERIAAAADMRATRRAFEEFARTIAHADAPDVAPISGERSAFSRRSRFR